MAKVTPPKIGAKPSKVVQLTTTEKPSPTDEKPIQFKVDQATQIEFKSYATSKGMSMKALFLDIYEEYKRNHP